MSDGRQPPRVVASYSQGIEARNAQRQEERRNNPLFPNLAQAAVTHDPSRGQTLATVGMEQRADREASTPVRGQLSEETVAGLRAVYDEQQRQAAQRAAEPLAAPSSAPEAPPPAPPAPAQAAEVEEPAELPPREDLDPEDVEFAAAMRRMREDLIHNERERKAVAARSGPIDMSDVLTGEFTQLVPVVPGKLEVRFKCLTTAENTRLRLRVIEEVEKEPQKAHLAKELLGFYQTVACVVSLNKTTFPRHAEVNTATMQTEFHDKIFDQKVQLFQQYPLPLIGALGTHSAWFEQRVRELFVTTEALKNG